MKQNVKTVNYIVTYRERLCIGNQTTHCTLTYKTKNGAVRGMRNGLSKGYTDIRLFELKGVIANKLDILPFLHKFNNPK